jgi:elongation factor 1-gamma
MRFAVTVSFNQHSEMAKCVQYFFLFLSLFLCLQLVLFFFVVARLKGKLYGSTLYETALIDQWLDFASTQILPPTMTWVMPLLGHGEITSEALQKATADVKKTLTVLNTHLTHHQFLVGERISLADIVVASSVGVLYLHVFDPPARKQYSSVTRWFITMINQPEFRSVIGEVKLCEKAPTIPTTSSASSTATNKATEQQQQQQQPKKESKKESKKKKDEEEEPPEDDEFKEPKKKSKLESLPPSTFNLDEWKRTYSNLKDTRKDALPWLWKNFDPQGYSFWFADYKYSSELNTEPLFKILNLVNGWIQRLDQLRKWGFGTIIIFGKEGDIHIGSAWLFRGLEIPEEVRPLSTISN